MQPKHFIWDSKPDICLVPLLRVLLLLIFQKVIREFIQDSICFNSNTRGGSRTAATSKIERFVIIANGFKPLIIITKRSILDVAAVLDPPLDTASFVNSGNHITL